MKIVIVGNGIGASYQNNGNFIDNCDIVIRMNKFVLEGHRSQIGSKIDYISLMITGEGATAGILGHQPLSEYIKSAKQIWIPDKHRAEHTPNRTRALEHFRLPEDYQFNFVEDGIYDALMSKMKLISESMGDVRDHYYPDSGMTTIEKCVNLYPNDEIYITGFDPHKKHPPKYYHKVNGEKPDILNCHPQLAQSVVYDEYKSIGKLREI